MKISQVSTQSMFDNLRYSMSNIQRDFVDAQAEGGFELFEAFGISTHQIGNRQAGLLGRQHVLEAVFVRTGLEAGPRGAPPRPRRALARRAGQLQYRRGLLASR